MGELLLSGWTMLADSCPSCPVPLMRSPSGGAAVCVACGYGDDDGGVVVRDPNPPRSPDVREENETEVIGVDDDDAGCVGGEEGGLGELRKRSGSPAGKLADRMLDGWTMLGSYCPICRTPLCREKGTGRVECVGCELEVRHEGGGGGGGGNVVGVADVEGKEDVNLVGMKRRVMGRVLAFMDEVAGGLVGGGDVAVVEARLGTLAVAADVLAKLGGVRFRQGNGTKRDDVA